MEPKIPDTPETLTDPRRKRAYFRAWHRGTREMDIVMGRFAAREMATLSEDELSLFERLLEEPDPVVYDWVCGRGEIPAPYDGPLLARLREFRREVFPIPARPTPA